MRSAASTSRLPPMGLPPIPRGTMARPWPGLQLAGIFLLLWLFLTTRHWPKSTTLPSMALRSFNANQPCRPAKRPWGKLLGAQVPIISRPMTMTVSLPGRAPRHWSCWPRQATWTASSHPWVAGVCWLVQFLPPALASGFLALNRPWQMMPFGH